MSPLPLFEFGWVGHREVVLNNIIVFSALVAALGSIQSFAEPRPYALDKGEALVVLQIEDAKGMSIDSLIFNHIDSKQKIVIKCRKVVWSKPVERGCSRSTPLKVSSGRYYLRSIKAYSGSKVHIDTSAAPLLMSRPDDPAKTIEVKEGAVTYLGDWVFRKHSGKELGRNISFEVNAETLSHIASNYPKLKLTPLYYANQSGLVKLVSWP